MVKKAIAGLRQNTFLRLNAIFFVGSLTTSFINYLYYPVLGRLLPTAAFGEVQVLVALFTQIMVLLSVLTIISTNIVVNGKDQAVVNRTVSELEKLALLVGVSLLVIITLLSPVLQAAFQFQSAWPFIITGLVLVASIPLAFQTAYLRGKNDFKSTSIEGIIASTLKIIFSAVLITLGFKTTGAVGGILIAQLCALAYAISRARKLGFRRLKTKSNKLDWTLIKPELPYALLVLIVSLITTFQYSLDITLIKYLFSPEVAGQYASIATVSRIVLFVTGSFSIVLLSAVKQDQPPQQNSRLLIRSLLLTIALGGTATVIFVLFPKAVVHLLFGERYDTYVSLLPALSIAMFLMSLSNLLALYHVALRHYRVWFFMGIGAAATYGFLIGSHASPAAVVDGILLGSGIMLASLLGWTSYRALPLVRKVSSWPKP